jgi:glycosyltransferase involved in cell wall biosynthesis
VLDNKVNKWALQRFEPLKNEIDIMVFIGENNDYDTSAIDLKKKQLTHFKEIKLALKDSVTAYKRIVKSPFKKMDFYFFSLRKYLDGFDAVYSCDITRSAYTLASLKDSLGFKLLLSWWENIPFRAVLDKKTNFQKRLVMDKVDIFLPFTETAKNVLKMEGVPEDKLKVIYPGVNLERFKPGNKPGGLLSKHNIAANCFIILYVGKIVSWKGVHNLAYAARVLKQKGWGDFIIVVVGRGAQKENLENLTKEARVGEHFRFLDFISYDEIPDIYRMADTFILPSYPTMTWQEQFGMVLTEAMATGVPVISTNSGSIPEVVGDAGILINPGDYMALSDAIMLLMHDHNLRERLGKAGRIRAEQLFCSKQNAEKFLHFLKNIFKK